MKRLKDLSDDDAALGLAFLSGGPGRGVLRLLGHHAPSTLWRASVHDLETWGLLPRAAARLAGLRRDVSIEAAKESVSAAGLRFVPFGAPGFPPELSHLGMPPAGLFVRGSEGALVRLALTARVTIVGTRRATSYGARAAERFATAFAVAGVAVASGLAYGIDTYAHKAAVSVEGLTVAILGCGADVVYPRSNARLYERIADTGLVISELPPGAPSTRWTFPHRNRLLAALGDAVLVVEAPPASGALQTASAALEIGRPVYAVPGSIFSEGYKGCNSLLRDGAGPAIEPDAFVEEFLQQTRIERGNRQVAGDCAKSWLANGQLCLPQGATSRHEAVWGALANGACSVDGLTGRTGLSVRELMTALVELEFAGLVQRAGPGAYARAP